MAEPSDPAAPVRFEEIATASNFRFGRATLDAPASLNALTLDMVDRLSERLDAWSRDAGIVGVMIDASGDKAFCAGGDVLALYRSMRAADGAVPTEAARFFEREYRLDHRIHTYPKPVLCWGHGIVMGGGVGLFCGASHRVVTPRTRFAMPEITIGLYPDVGGSWFLARMRARTGLFLALTGVPLHAADLRHAGLADYTVPHERHADARDAIAATRWSGVDDDDRAQLSHLLDNLAAPADMQASPLREHAGLIDETMGNDTLADVALRLGALGEHADAWLATAGRAFARGSPTSAMLGFRLQQRARHLSLADVFRMEYHASIGCAMGHDFPEGIRALLVDKDRNPRWMPDRLEQVRPEDIDACLQAHHPGEHPLADLH